MNLPGADFELIREIARSAAFQEVLVSPFGIFVRNGIADPFADISGHVENAEWARSGREPSGRNQALIKSVEVRALDRRRIRSPGVAAVVQLRSGRVLPLRRGGNRSALRCAVCLRLRNGNVGHGEGTVEWIVNVFLEVAGIVRRAAFSCADTIEVCSNRDRALIHFESDPVSRLFSGDQEKPGTRDRSWTDPDSRSEKFVGPKETVR